jgi:hypothetical protein
VVSISTGAAGPPRPAEDCPQHHLGLDLGEVAPGHRLIADGWCLHRGYLTLFYHFTGAPPGEAWESADLFLNAWYGADVSPPDGNFHGAFGLAKDSGRLEGTIEYTRPPDEATVAWLDIFDVDFDVDIHVSRNGPDEDYLRSRISRLTLDLAGRTGSAEFFRGAGGSPGG